MDSDLDEEVKFDELIYEKQMSYDEKRGSEVLSEMTEPVTLDELIPELFAIPDSDPPTTNHKNIITNPMPFIPIIRGLRSGRRVEVIEHILGMFSKCYHNNIIVNDPMNRGKYNLDLVKLCISTYFSDFAKSDPPTREVLLKFIKQITIGGRYQKSHFETIYGYIARNPEDLYGCLELIENMICVDTNHIPMFYFSDYESYIEINPLLTIEKAFTNAFGFAISFRIETLNGIRTQEEYAEASPELRMSSGERYGSRLSSYSEADRFPSTKTKKFNKYSTLFSIYCNGHGGFEAYFDDNTLYYKTLSGKGYVHGPEAKAEEVYDFEPEKWYTLIISH